MHWTYFFIGYFFLHHVFRLFAWRLFSCRTCACRCIYKFRKFPTVNKRCRSQTFNVHNKHCQCCKWKRRKSFVKKKSFNCFVVFTLLQALTKFTDDQIKVFFVFVFLSKSIQTIHRHNVTLSKKHNLQRPCCRFFFLSTECSMRSGGKAIRNAETGYFSLDHWIHKLLQFNQNSRNHILKVHWRYVCLN
jgi:hypothetical protein